MARILIVLTTLLILSACGYRFPENIRPVPGVEPYGGRELRQNTQGALGMVYAEADGSNCDEAITKAFTSLLEQAKALGGTKVIHAQTRNKFNWSGRLACSRGGRHASTRGVAVP